MQQQAKLTKQYDHYQRGERMVSYPKGFEGEMPQSHYDGAVAAGAVEGKNAPAEAKDVKDAPAKGAK